jgi:hypothetical protein
MREGVEGRQEEIASRHPLAALPFGAILTVSNFLDKPLMRGNVTHRNGDTTPARSSGWSQGST